VVAAAEADGDLARSQEPRAKDAESDRRVLGTRREAKGPRRAACWLETPGVAEAGTFHEVKVEPMLVGRWVRR